MKEEYKLQKKVEQSRAWYGIGSLSKLGVSFHRDVMRLLKSNKYKDLSSDEAMVIFGRVYSVYCLSRIIQEGKIKFVEDDKK